MIFQKFELSELWTKLLEKLNWKQQRNYLDWLPFHHQNLLDANEAKSINFQECLDWSILLHYHYITSHLMKIHCSDSLYKLILKYWSLLLYLVMLHFGNKDEKLNLHAFLLAPRPFNNSYKIPDRCKLAVEFPTHIHCVFSHATIKSLS